MARVHQLDGGLLVSISTLAREFGMARETVSKRIEQCGVIPAEKVNGSPVFRLSQAVKAILGVTRPSGHGDGSDPAALPPQDRLAWMRSESERLKVEEAKGQLIQAADHETELAAVIKRTVQTLATLPDRLERECGLSSEVVERIVAACDAARADLGRNR